jgi:hypothetical protein
MELSFGPYKSRDKIFLSQQLLLNKCKFLDGKLLTADNRSKIYAEDFCVQPELPTAM